MARNLIALRPLTAAARFASSLFNRAGKPANTSEPFFEALEERTLLAADVTATLTVPAFSGLASAGGALTGSIVLRNTGDAAATGFTYRVYLSTDSVIGNEDDVELTGEAGLTATLAAGAQTTVNMNTFTVPTDVRPGAYFVFAVLDTLNAVNEGQAGEANNTVSTASPVVTLNGPATATPNLTGSVTFSATTVRPDQQLSVPTVIRNTGTAAATEFHVTWVLSTNSIIGDADDIAIDSEVINSLAAGSQVSINRNITLPEGIDLGSYRVGVWVDDRADVPETNEADNRAITGNAALTVALPDITATFTTTGGTVAPGGFFTGTLTVRNLTAAAAGSFRVYISLSSDATGGNGDDRVLLTVDITDALNDSIGLAGNATRTISNLRVYIPYGSPSGGALPPGSYRVSVVADGGGDVDESNENNNVTITTNNVVTIPARNTENDPEGADLFAYAYPISGTFTPGQTINVAAIFANLGNAQATGGIAMSAYLSTDGTLDEEDVLLSENVLGDVETFGVGSTYSLVPLTISGDAANGTFYIIFRADPGNEVEESNEENNDAAAGTGTVTRGTVSITATDAAAAEVTTGTANGGVFRISRTGSTAADLVVTYTVSGTADEDDFNSDDFTGTITIPAGSSFALLDLSVINDSLAESDETVIVTIGEDSFYNVSETQHTATVTIADNEPRVTITAPDAAAAESSGTANGGQFRVTRTGATTGALVVTFDLVGTAGEDDYTLTSTVEGANLTFDFEEGTGTITIPAGQTSVTFNVVVTQDTLAEEPETVLISLQSGESYSVNPESYRATVTIADDEPIVTITASDAAAAESSGTANPGQFRVTRTGATTADLVVHYTVTGSATAGDDYTMLTGTVTILAGQTTALINVSVIDDAVGEDPETVVVTLSSQNTYRLSATESQRQATVTIADNEALVTVTASDAAAAEVASGTQNPGQFRFTRTGATTGSLVVHFTLAGTAGLTGDYTLTAQNGVTLVFDDETGEGTITIPAGQTTAAFNVTVTDDAVGENPETVVLTLDADDAYRMGTQAQRTATVTIADNEPLVTITASDAVAAETQGVVPANPGQFRVTRPSSNTAGDLVVHFSMSGTTAQSGDFTLTAAPGGTVTYDANTGLGTVTILTGQTTAVVNLVVTNDSTVEPNETAIMTLENDDAYRVSAVASQRAATVTIADNEPVVSLVATDRTATEGTVNGQNDFGNFRISRTGDLSQTLTVNVVVSGTASNGDWINFITTEMVIPAGEAFYDNPVIAQNDTLWEGVENITITLAAGTGYTLTNTASQRTATVTINDNESTVAVRAQDAAAAESSGVANPGQFRFTRTLGSNADPLTIHFQMSGTALFTEYTLGSGAAGSNVSFDDDTGLGTITIPAGAAFVDLNLVPVDDSVGELAETAIVTIVADPGYRLALSAAQRTARVNIADNEATVALTTNDRAAAEVSSGTANGGRYTFTRSLGGNAQDLVVHFTITGTATATDDFTLDSTATVVFDDETGEGTITIPAGSNTAILNINIVNDSLAEDAETVVLTVDEAAGYRLATSAAQRSGTVTIADNEPTVTIAARDAVAGEVFTGTANPGVFRITRTGATTGSLVVNYTVTGTATGGDDYTTLTGTVTIPVGAAFVDVNVAVLDDLDVEGSETVIVTLDAEDTYRLGTVAQRSATVNIADNEPTFNVTASDAAAAEGATNTGNFRITRTGGNSQITVVHFTLTGTATAGEDYTLSSPTAGASIVFDPETGEGTVTFTGTTTQVNILLTALTDAANDPNETAILTITGVEDGEQGYTIGAQSSATVTIANTVAP